MCKIIPKESFKGKVSAGNMTQDSNSENIVRDMKEVFMIIFFYFNIRPSCGLTEWKVI